jgi:hypothetical protein
MTRSPELPEGSAGLEAQQMVCEHLVRACRAALYDIALHQEGDETVRTEAVRIVKEILADWQEARSELRRLLAAQRQVLPPVKAR